MVFAIGDIVKLKDYPLVQFGYIIQLDYNPEYCRVEWFNDPKSLPWAPRIVHWVELHELIKVS